MRTIQGGGSSTSSVRDRLIEISGLSRNASILEVAKQFGSSSYVVRSIPLVLFAVQQIKQLGFVALLVDIVGAGGDTDTNAAIAGQIIGALIGQAGLPKEMIDRLPELDLIAETAREFSESVSSGLV
jgi:ADP-ribosylglycohydrolase